MSRLLNFGPINISTPVQISLALSSSDQRHFPWDMAPILSLLLAATLMMLESPQSKPRYYAELTRAAGTPVIGSDRLVDVSSQTVDNFLETLPTSSHHVPSSETPSPKHANLLRRLLNHTPFSTLSSLERSSRIPSPSYISS